MNISRIRVDYNKRGRDGVVLSNSRRADGPVKLGDTVVAYQPGEDMDHVAQIVAFDETSGRLELDVDWTGLSVKPAATVRTKTEGREALDSLLDALISVRRTYYTSSRPDEELPSTATLLTAGSDLIGAGR